MKEKILAFLKSYKRSKIALREIEDLFSGETEYKEIVTQIQSLVEERILEPVNSHGTNNKAEPLYNTYKILKRNLRQDLIEDIQQYSLKFHSQVQLQTYFSLSEAVWEEDLPYIKRIDRYLKEKGLPKGEVFVPELSYQLMGDEKWIDEKGGKKLLERLQLWQTFKIIREADPLMFSINPLQIQLNHHMHLIVENKTTYYQLEEILRETSFTSLIYGAGWKIVSNVHLAVQQMGLYDRFHQFYYFGDIDAEGISIWHTLNEKQSISLALPFYRVLLKKSNSFGKETQYKNKEALEVFSKKFTSEEEKKLHAIFEKHEYYPQEALDKRELHDIWRNFNGA